MFANNTSLQGLRRVKYLNIFSTSFGNVIDFFPIIFLRQIPPPIKIDLNKRNTYYKRVASSRLELKLIYYTFAQRLHRTIRNKYISLFENLNIYA